jgi:CO dehydrogenase maturation factor
MCRAHAAVRSLLRELLDAAGDVAVADMEAGLENFSRGTPRHTDTVISVVEPYYRSLETGARVVELARELGVPRVHVVANKIRDEGDREAVAAFCQARGLEIFASVPHDAAVLDADRSRSALLDRAPASAAVAAITELAARLLGSAPGP